VSGRETLLEVENLSVEFAVGGQRLKAVRGLNLQVDAAHTVGLVGESGCGKTVSMLAVLGLLAPNAIVRGSIRYRGEPLDTPQKVKAVRGSRIAMVFQDSMNSLNPLMKVGVQVAEALRRHQNLDRDEARAKAIQYLERVRLPTARDIYQAYPHELSGGMRQRVMIAGALACGPELLIADEPTTGLDVTVQAKILDLLVELQSETGLAVVFVSHDIGAIAELCEDLVVVYGGRAVERGRTAEVLAGPRHPYTRALLESVPAIGQRQPLTGIEGLPPPPHAYPRGCSFEPRCSRALAGQCDQPPPLVEIAPGREVECWLEAVGSHA
jgi:oligopeptide/dipeptide ABC transporter ATP-binding protein